MAPLYVWAMCRAMFIRRLHARSVLYGTFTCMGEVSDNVHKTPTCAERTIWHLYMYERCVGHCS